MLFGRDLHNVYPDLLRFDCPGHLPIIFVKIWDSPTEIQYEMTQTVLVNDVAVQGPEMVISVKPKEKLVEAVSTSFALPFGEVVIIYDDETRSFQAKETDDQNLFLCNWLESAINKPFRRVRPLLPEDDAKAQRFANRERKKMHQILAIASVLVRPCSKSAGVFIVTD